MSRLRPHQAAQILNVNPRTLHRWAREGRLTRYPDGFDIADLLTAEKNRDPAALCIRAGLKREHWPDTLTQRCA